MVKSRFPSKRQEPSLRIDSSMAEAFSHGIREPRNQGDVRTEGEISQMARVTFEGIQLIGNKQNQKPTRLQDATAFLEHLPLAIRMFQDFDHGDSIKAFGSERQVFAGRLHPRYGCAEGFQVRHLPVHSTNIGRTSYQLSGIGAIATAQVENPHTPEIDGFVDLVQPSFDAVGAIRSGHAESG